MNKSKILSLGVDPLERCPLALHSVVSLHGHQRDDVFLLSGRRILMCVQKHCLIHFFHANSHMLLFSLHVSTTELGRFLALVSSN